MRGLNEFFHHVDRPMRIMVDLMRRGRPAAGVMDVLAAEERAFAEQLKSAGRNGSCPCGSGRKVKHCHGETTSTPPLPEFRDSPRAPVTERGRRSAQRRPD